MVKVKKYEQNMKMVLKYQQILLFNCVLFVLFYGYFRINLYKFL